MLEKSTHFTGISEKQFKKEFISKERNIVKSRTEEINK